MTPSVLATNAKIAPASTAFNPVKFAAWTKSTAPSPAPQDVFTPRQQARPSVQSKPVFSIPKLRFGQASAEQWPEGVQVSPDNKVRFKLWAPNAYRVELLQIKPLAETSLPLPQDRIVKTFDMKADGKGSFQLDYEENDFRPGMLYMYRLHKLDGAVSKPLPDYRTQYQPEDVHGPSQVLPPSTFKWTDQNWKTPWDTRRLVFDRVHIGTFTPEGTFDAAIQKLDYLKNELGVNAIKLMPVKEFSGRWNWGYDMVDYFAVENAYGKPDDLRRLVDECHKRGIAVVLDVVYNHIGPEGSYFSEYDRSFTKQGVVQWGDSFNFDNPKAKKYVMDNIAHWINEFHVDGFRFDQIPNIKTEGSGPPREDIIREMTQAAYDAKRVLDPQNPNLILIAEDGRNVKRTTIPHDWVTNHGNLKEHDDQILPGLGFNAVYNFDFHHAAKGVVTGKSHMEGPTTVSGLADVLRRGFRWPENNWMRLLEQQFIFTQSHDEVGNHNGKRMYEDVGPQKARLSAVLKFLVPGIPEIFQGEEYGEKNPFYFFVDHKDEVVVDNLEREHLANKGTSIPLCTQPKAFEDSKLSWKKDQGLFNLNQDMIRLRQTVPALWQGGREQMIVDESMAGSNVLLIQRQGKENPDDKVFIAINFSDYDYQYKPEKQAWGFDLPFPDGKWREVLNTDDARYGGSNSTNKSQAFKGRSSVNLPPRSVVIFQKDPT